MCTSVSLPTMHCHVAVPLLHDSPVLLLREQRGGRISPIQVSHLQKCTADEYISTADADISTLTSTSAAPGSLLKHMVMVFRAILKKLVKDTDFPCNKETSNVRLSIGNVPSRPEPSRKKCVGIKLEGISNGVPTATGFQSAGVQA